MVKENYLTIPPEELSPEQTTLVRKLSLLYEISQAMMTTLNLNALLHIIMTAVTMEGGFGFNRAMLFLVNQNANALQGMIGVGPESPADACRIWNEFSQQKVGLLEWALSPRRSFSRVESKIDEVCKNTIVPLDPEEGGILARTVLEKNFFNVRYDDVDEFVQKNIFSQIGGGAFATVPIIAKGEATGVIKVDNIYNQRPITDDDIKMLTIFASQAGMAIENSRLYQNMEIAHNELKEAQEKLIRKEKLAVLGELAGGVAHELRNPLGVLSNAIYFLKITLADADETTKEYLDIISAEIRKSEKIVTDLLGFSRTRLTEKTEREEVEV